MNLRKTSPSTPLSGRAPAIHFGSIIHILGLLMIFIGGTMMLVTPIAFIYGDGGILAFPFSALITAVSGFIAFKYTDFGGELRAKEGFAIVTLGWLSASIFGCLPFIFMGAAPSITDAFFETISGFTTTGATIMSDIEGLPHSILFWRSLTHWLGGMGIIVLSLAILPFLGIGGMQLFKAEVPGPVADKLTPRITQTAKILWAVYVALTAIEMGLLMYGGMDWFDAITHSFATLSTGGFSPNNSSVGEYSPFLQYVIILFMFLAGINFSLHFRFISGSFLSYFKNREFLIYCSLITIVTVIISIDVFRRFGGLEQAFRDTLFQVVAIVTSTGFGTADFEQWSFSSQFLLYGLMFIGGCAGSTGGGMKVVRWYIVVKFVFSEVKRLLHPNAVIPVRMDGATVPTSVIMHILGFFVLYILIYGVSVFLLALMGLDMHTSFTAAVSALSNIGPGLGDIGPTENYGGLPTMAKWLLCFLMLMGRLEIFTVFVLFSPAYWRK